MKRKTWIVLFLAMALMLTGMQLASAGTDATLTVPATITGFPSNAVPTGSEFSISRWNTAATVTKYLVSMNIGGATVRTTYTENLSTGKVSHGAFTMDVTSVLNLSGFGTGEVYYSSAGNYTGYRLYRGNYAQETIPLSLTILHGNTVSSSGFSSDAIARAAAQMSGPNGGYGYYGYYPYYVYGNYIPYYGPAPDSTPTTTEGTWRTSPSGKWFELPDGSYVKNQWKAIGGKWYFFDNKGYLMTNSWIANKYYVGSDGAMVTDSWIDGKYYVDANGEWQPSAKAKTGWIKDGNGWWYRNADGTYPKSAWRWIDGNGDGLSECYYFNAQGYLVTNTSIDGSTVNGDGAWVVNGVVQHKTR